MRAWRSQAGVRQIKRDRVSQSLIGSFGWSHTGRSFDGAHYAIAGKATNTTLVAALPTRGAFQVDGWGNLKAGFVYAALTRQVPRVRHNAEWRAFGIYYHDWRNVAKVDNRPLGLRNPDRANIRPGTFGGHYLHGASTGTGVFDAMLWGVLQTGRILPTPHPYSRFPFST